MPGYRLVEVSAGALSVVGLVLGFGRTPAAAQRVGVTAQMAARASMPAATTSGMTPAITGGGNVTATVPEAAFGPVDTAPAVVVGGHEYPIVVTVWVAPGSGPATVEISGNAGRLANCPVETVKDGVTRLRCSLRVSGTPVAEPDVVVSARLADGTKITRSYDHTRT
jgi:hypothetical protein